MTVCATKIDQNCPRQKWVSKLPQIRSTQGKDNGEGVEGIMTSHSWAGIWSIVSDKGEDTNQEISIVEGWHFVKLAAFL